MDTIRKLETALFYPIQFFSSEKTRQEALKVTKAISATTTFLSDSKIYQVADSFRQFVRSMGQVVAAYNLFFVIPELMASVQKAINTEKIVTRYKAIIRSISSSAAIVSFGAMLAGIGSIVSRVFFPLSVVDTAINLNKMRKNKLFYDELRGKVQDKTYVYRNRKRIAKKLKFKVQGNDLQQAQKLQSCIDRKERFGMANSALKVAGVVASGLLLFTPAVPVTLGFAAGTAVAGLALFKVEQMVG